MSLNTVTVTWDELDVGQAPLGGYVSFQLSSIEADSADGIDIHPSPPKTYFFVSATGASDPLVANDNASLVPAGSYYTVTVAIRGQQPYSFATQVNFAAGATQTLAYLIANQAVPVAQFSQYVPLQGGVALGGAIAPRDITLTDAATVTPTPALANDFTLLMTSAVGSTRAIAAAAPLADCQTIRFLLVQPAGGGPCSVTWATGANGWDFGSAGSPTLSQTADQGDIAGFQFRTINGTGKWRYLGDQGGYS